MNKKNEMYFVNVVKADGHTDRWEMLTAVQANHIYAEQVEIHGMNRCSTGRC
mgnify:FL=1